MMNTLLYTGLPIVGAIAIACAIVYCIGMRVGKIPVEDMSKEAKEFMETLILKFVKWEIAVMFLVKIIQLFLLRNITTMPIGTFNVVCGLTFFVMWLDIIMMALTFVLVFQTTLSKQSDNNKQ